MNYQSLKNALGAISELMTENKDYLIELDQKNGDGDLGVSMASGYSAVKDYIETTEERDLGQLLRKISSVFNETAPSSLGTITSLGMMGMAKSLKGKTEASFGEFGTALQVGLENIMAKAKSKPGEKTILDSLHPAIEVIIKNADTTDIKSALKEAFDAAEEGSENTRNMKSVHGRAAYYTDNSIGVLDGGSVVGKLIIKGIYQSYE